jgi:ATP-binding protein involved in chromosome partitioning
MGIVENMSGLMCPHCGKSIDLFKTKGGQLTAKKEGLRLLASLPIEPEVVKRGDAGDLSYLDEERLQFTIEFNRLVDQVEDLSVKESSVTIQ